MINTYKTQLVQKVHLTSDVFLYRFKLVNPLAIAFIPGQYVILMVPLENGEKARRLYSIASSNTLTNEFELLVKLVLNGCASCYFEKLQIGSECEFQGPAGMFTLRESPREKIALVTGTGYAPIRSMLLSNIQHLTSSISLFFGFPYYKDVFLFDELKQLTIQSSNNLKFYICLSREQNLDMIPEKDKKYFLLGRVTKGLESLMIEDRNWKLDKEVRDLKLENQTSTFQPQDQVSSIQSLSSNVLLSNFDFYLCSGRDVVNSLKEYLYQKGASKEQVYFEKF